MRDADAPTLHRLAADGLFAPGLLDLRAGAVSDSAPGWSTLATGVWADKHGVLDNSFAGKRYDRYPDFLTRVRRADPTRSTFAAVDWHPLCEEGTFGPEVSGRVALETDEEGHAILLADE